MKNNIFALFLAVLVYGCIFAFGYVIGKDHGYSKASERQRKNKCESTYMFEPWTQVSAECYKYFEIKL